MSKKRESEQKKLAGEVKRSEERQNGYRKEKDFLEAELAANPAAWKPELAGRFEELSRLISEEEQRWVQLTEQLESLSSEEKG